MLNISQMNGVFDFGYSSIFDGFAFVKTNDGPNGWSSKPKYYKKDYFGNLKVFNASHNKIKETIFFQECCKRKRT